MMFTDRIRTVKPLTNIISLQFLQRITHTDVDTMARVAGEVGRWDSGTLGVAAIVHAELGCQDHRIAILAGRQPFTDPRLRLFVLVVIGGVDEVTTGRVEGIEKLEGGVLVHGAHHAGPGVANGHAAQLQWGDSDTCGRREDAEAAELGGRVWFSHD